MWILNDLIKKMSAGISPPDVGDLSRRFEGAMTFLIKGGVSIFELLLMKPSHS